MGVGAFVIGLRLSQISSFSLGRNIRFLLHVLSMHIPLMKPFQMMLGPRWTLLIFPVLLPLGPFVFNKHILFYLQETMNDNKDNTKPYLQYNSVQSEGKPNPYEMSTVNTSTGTESRDNRLVNQTSDGSRDMGSSEATKRFQKLGVQIKEEPNMDDTSGTSNRNETGFNGQLHVSHYPSDNSGKGKLGQSDRNFYVRIKEEPSKYSTSVTPSCNETGLSVNTGKGNLDACNGPRVAFRDGTDYAVCIKYEPNSCEEIDPDASINDVNPSKAYVQTKNYDILGNTDIRHPYQHHPDNVHPFHASVDKRHCYGDCKPAPDDLQNQDTQMKYGPMKCKIAEHPIQKNTVYCNNHNGGSSVQNNHDHSHIFSISYEKIYSSDSDDSSAERQRNTQKVFRCDICSYRVTLPCETNYQKDTEVKQYKCDMCSYNTVYPRNLALHNEKHTSDKPYKCNVCIYSTYRSSSLEMHKRKHTGENRFKCDMCSYSTNWNSELRRHKRKHTGEKPYKCDV